MADGNSFKLDDDLNIADTDPMAELTRIMSFGTPSAREEVAAEAEDGFTLDLEHELLGDDFAVEEPLALAPVAADTVSLSARSGFSIAEPAPAAPSRTALLDDLDLDLDEALGSAFSGEEPEASLADDVFTAAQAQDEAETPEETFAEAFRNADFGADANGEQAFGEDVLAEGETVAFADTAEDAFADAFQNADFDRGVDFVADEPAPASVAYQLNEPEAADEADELMDGFADPFAGEEGEALFADTSELDAADAEEAGWQAFQAHELESAAARPLDETVGEADPVLAAMEEIARLPEFAPRGEPSVDLTEQQDAYAEDQSATTGSGDPSGFDDTLGVLDAALDMEPDTAGDQAGSYRFDDDGIEDELAAMLEGRAPAFASPAQEDWAGAEQIGSEDEAPVGVSAADFDLSDFDEDAFLEQEFAGDDLGLGEEAVEELARLEPVEQTSANPAEEPLQFDPELLAGIEAAADDWNAPSGEEPLFADDAAWQELDAVEHAVDVSPVPVNYPEEATASHDDAAFEKPEQPGTMATGAAAIATAGTVAAVKAGGLTSGFLSRFSRPDAHAAAVDVPDIETSEIVETAIEPAGDLELPDLVMDQDEPVHASASGYEDFYAQGYQTQAVSTGEPDIGHDDTLTTEFDTLFAQEMAASGYPAQQASASTRDEHVQSSAYQDSRFDGASLAMEEAEKHDGYDSELDRDLAAGFDEGQPLGEPRRNQRGLLVAAVVAGVALLGGIGAFALNFSGGDKADDGSAIVRADKAPVKVKPAEKEAAEAPTAGKVYDQVAGKPVAEKPSQKSLVTTEAKPVDVNASGVRVITPGPTDDASAAKSEDRIDPASATEPEQAPEIAAVRPKRVKTFIVRPDGTLVASEEPAAPAAPVAAPNPAEPAVKAAEPAPQPEAPKENVVASAKAEPEPAALKPVVAPKPAPKAASADKVEAKPVRTTSVKPPKAPDAVPVVPSRPSDQPVNIVGTTRAANATPTATPVSAPAASQVASSPAWVQISSHPTRELAQASYRNAQARFGSIINGKGVNIAAAEIPGRGTFHRVNIPAASFNEAAALCKRIKAAGGDCLAKR